MKRYKGLILDGAGFIEFRFETPFYSDNWAGERMALYMGKKILAAWQAQYPHDQFHLVMNPAEG